MVQSEDSDDSPLLEACTSCGTLIDVSEQTTFEKVHCPSCGVAMRVRRLFNHYELVDILGVGGMGTVYKALDLNLHRHVALKVLKKEYGDDEGSLAELEREARITASINHPHVVKVFSFGQARGQLYFAMELVEKGSLDDLMTLQNRVPEIQVLQTGIQLAQGLEAAYKVGLIHSDIKPGNILFADAKNAKIVDFGLAVLMSQEAEASGEIWGTPYYVSPERLNKQPEDFRSDIYSLGGTLFHALAGRPPFEAETASLVALKHIKSKAVSLQAFAPDVSSETAYVINRMLKKDPEERYGSYKELIEHLTYAHSKLGEAAASGRRGRAKVVVEDARSKQLGAYLTLGLLATIIVLGVVLALNWSRVTGTYEEDIDYKPPVNSSGGRNGEAQGKYEAAVKVLLKGDYANAGRGLALLEVEGGLSQPLRNWVVLQQAVASLLGNQPADAREKFAQLEQGGIYSMDPAERDTAKFFVEAGKLFKAETPVAPSVAKMYSAFGVESFMAFLIGLQNWEAGNYENAHEAFVIFQDAHPGEQDQWIDEFKTFTQQFIEDFGRFEKANDLMEKATDSASLKLALKEVTAARKRLMAGSPLNKKLEAMEAQIKEYIADPKRFVPARITPPTATPGPAPKPTATPTPTPPKVDAKLLAAENARMAQFDNDYPKVLRAREFKAFLKDLAAFKPTIKEVQQRHKALRIKVGMLDGFFALLINDLNTTGFDQAIPRGKSRGIKGKVGNVDRAGFTVKVEYGSLPVRWSEITPQVMVGLAKHFAARAPRDTPIAERHWLAGGYAYQYGLKEIGTELLEAAVAADASREAELNLILSSD